MFRFPFYSYPYNYQYYKNYINMQNKKNEEKNSITNSIEVSNTINSDNNSNRNIKTKSGLNSIFNFNFSSLYNSNSEQAIFEIFGIKLYLDDLIIIGLLFFLYNQDVKDEMLYIILLLLLFA